ncbi:MAG: APC family permease [Acidobacteria bacterium]|nr:APC family permease [Acidobacteriota bacterium]
MSTSVDGAPLSRQRIVIASTVALSFISFWRAAAIVLSDLASSAYYVGGIAEQAIGKAAPWFILGIMLFSYAVRAVYIEGCAMYVRGGVYRVVHEALGPRMAKLAVSALMFDYVLTGPISAVSAGLYIAGLLNESAGHFLHQNQPVNEPAFAVAFALAVTLYFWWQNIKGIHESSQKALRIMQVTTAMVVTLILWSIYTMLAKGYQPVPLPTISNLHLSPESLGWLPMNWATSIPAIAVLVGLGHSLLAMSGEETLAQVNREIAHPKLKNLERAGLVIFIYSLLFTSLVSFFAVMLIPDGDRKHFLDNLISGLAMHLAGPDMLKLAFQAVVVAIGALILAGAVNTSIIGSNGVLNRVAEDRVLPLWFRKPHKKFGTTYRMVNMIVLLQLATILLSRGDVYLLGEAYAFGVVWSFAFNATSVLILRFKNREPREWKVPLNLKVGGVELPIGLSLITLSLFTLAITNVLTKKLATIWGTVFTLAFFVLFVVSEKINLRRSSAAGASHEQFRLDEADEVSSGAIDVRTGSVLVAVRNPRKLQHLKRVLEKTDPRKQDIVEVSISDEATPFTERESELFTSVVTLAEKAGKTVKLLTVPGTNALYALVQTAAQLQSNRIVIGGSPNAGPAQLGHTIGLQWEKLPEPRPSISLEIVAEDPEEKPFFVNLGPHPPRLWPEDIELLHQLWLQLTDEGPGHKLRHRDVVGVALHRLRMDLAGERRKEVMEDVHRAANH